MLHTERIHRATRVGVPRGRRVAFRANSQSWDGTVCNHRNGGSYKILCHSSSRAYTQNAGARQRTSPQQKQKTHMPPPRTRPRTRSLKQPYTTERGTTIERANRQCQSNLNVLLLILLLYGTRLNVGVPGAAHELSLHDGKSADGIAVLRQQRVLLQPQHTPGRAARCQERGGAR